MVAGAHVTIERGGRGGGNGALFFLTGGAAQGACTVADCERDSEGGGEPHGDAGEGGQVKGSSEVQAGAGGGEAGSKGRGHVAEELGALALHEIQELLGHPTDACNRDIRGTCARSYSKNQFKPPTPLPSGFHEPCAMQPHCDSKPMRNSMMPAPCSSACKPAPTVTKYNTMSHAVGYESS